MAERIHLSGRVQGVGMRPTLYRLAEERGLYGSIRNDGAGVELCLQASSGQIDEFLGALQAQLPPLAVLEQCQRQPLPAGGEPFSGLRILPSQHQEQGAQVLPDAATCEACLAEILLPGQRRYHYPFANCTHCGPRFSIQIQIPWDRESTSMADFALCPACNAEHQAIDDRRYQAQAIACPQCGPQCVYQSADAASQSHGEAALQAALACLQAGGIVAIKGLGGFHLACDARNARAIQTLRLRKHRPSKALALMARDLEVLGAHVECDEQAARELLSPAAPIMLLPRRQSSSLPDSLAPGLDQLGVMLPATPLQHLLLQALDFPLVMTSGNVAGEPPCIDNDQALAQLAPIADGFLLHDRPIINRVDDSVLQMRHGRRQVLRFARGLAPGCFAHAWNNPLRVLALGAHLKASFALLREGQWIVSQHVGDLELAANLADFETALERYLALYEFSPQVIAVDAHPGYLSHQLGQRLARERQLPLVTVQHHHAHAAACMAEQGYAQAAPAMLAVCFDGLGYGANGELWGGEFLRVNFQGYERLARWRPAALPGGTAAMREPWRNLFAIIHQLGGWPHFLKDYPELARMLNWPKSPEQMQMLLDRQFNAPLCSSVGRSFDAMAWLLGLSPDQLSYEGEAAMRLQAAAEPSSAALLAPIELRCEEGLWELDWRAMWASALAARQTQRPVADIAASFHHALAQAVADCCATLQQQQALPDSVILCGGVFQNLTLRMCCEQALHAQGLNAICAEQLPCNDGGLAAGQAFIAAAQAQSA